MIVEVPYGAFVEMVAAHADQHGEQAAADLRDFMILWSKETVADLGCRDSQVISFRYESTDVTAPPMVEIYSLDETGQRFTVRPFLGLDVDGGWILGPEGPATEWVQGRIPLPDVMARVLSDA